MRSCGVVIIVTASTRTFLDSLSDDALYSCRAGAAAVCLMFFTTTRAGFPMATQ